MTPTEFLFDSTALIDIYRGRTELKSYLDALVRQEITGYISVITEAELWRGLRSYEFERHEALLTRFTSLPLLAQSARQAGAWMQQFQPVGLGWMDAFIVATAKNANLTVLTRDARLITCLDGQADFQLYHFI